MSIHSSSQQYKNNTCTLPSGNSNGHSWKFQQLLDHWTVPVSRDEPRTRKSPRSHGRTPPPAGRPAGFQYLTGGRQLKYARMIPDVRRRIAARGEMDGLFWVGSVVRI